MNKQTFLIHTHVEENYIWWVHLCYWCLISMICWFLFLRTAQRIIYYFIFPTNVLFIFATWCDLTIDQPTMFTIHTLSFNRCWCGFFKTINTHLTEVCFSFTSVCAWIWTSFLQFMYTVNMQGFADLN